MKPQAITFAFFAGLMLVLVAASRPYQNTFDKISVHEFELLDQKGKKRASIKVEPGGEVVFRLMDDTGTIRVKMGAGEDGSGLVLLDHNTNPGIHALAKKMGSSLTVIGQDGKKREY